MSFDSISLLFNRFYLIDLDENKVRVNFLMKYFLKEKNHDMRVRLR